MDNCTVEEARHSKEEIKSNVEVTFPCQDAESKQDGSNMDNNLTLVGKEEAKMSNVQTTTEVTTENGSNIVEIRKNVVNFEELHPEQDKIIDNLQSKSIIDDADSPSANDDKPGRRKRKPSRFHDSMFDIPTNLMNINRTINPEEFRAFHSKSLKTKEKVKKLLPIVESETTEKSNIESPDSPKPKPSQPQSPSYQQEDNEHGDDVLDVSNMFKFKMRKDHVIHSTIGGATVYRCDICIMTFPRSFSLRRHYTRRHVNPRYVLPKAGSINVTEGDNPEWIASLPMPDEKADGSIESKYLYYCKMCSKDLMYFEHKDQLRNHCLENHSSLPRRPVNVFKCELCKRSYSTKHELDRHKRTHSGERPYSCSFCGKTFPTSTNARRHERTHTGDKSHICKVCDKSFTQRSDMVKHLRSIHKMKVTKTKAQRTDQKSSLKSGKNFGSNTSGRDNSGKTNKPSEFGVDGNNEFQENIDFAAYLKLDQHDSGTLMGEKRQPRGALISNPIPEKHQNNSNNLSTHPGSSSKGLKDLKPNELLGADGKPEKWHRCPDCSKMFTSNINLRRHHKLKHERNQLYQCAEPVSMVVEKYKIKSENAASSFGKMSSPPEKKTIDNVKQPDHTENTKVFNADEVAVKNIPKTQEKTSPKHSKKQSKIMKSKLSNIVQRLAHKRSAEQPSVVNDNTGSMTSPPDLQPIIKLEEMENQMFRDYFSPETNLSPQRKRRKPNNVQHVKAVPSFDEKLQSCIVRDTNVRLRREKHFAPPYKHHTFENIPRSSGSKIPDLIGDRSSPFNQMYPIHERQIQKPRFQNMFLHDKLNKKWKPSFQEPMHEYISNDYHHPMSTHLPRSSTPSEITRSFAPLTSQPFPVQQHGQHPRSLSRESEDPEQSCRIQTFLSQCWSSKRHDIPQNAILDKTMPVRDANAMNRKLKYHMRHMPSERANEHLPPAAYFSQRDSISSGYNPTRMHKIFPQNIHKSGEARSTQYHDIPDIPVPSFGKKETSMYEGDVVEEDAPLDLRIQSKKTVPDFVVTDDGVLDFSRKPKENCKKKIISPPRLNTDRIQIKREMDKTDFRSHRNSPAPYQHWIENSNDYIPSSVDMKPRSSSSMNEHRRAIIHGRNLSENTRKPFKFHSVNFESPRLHSPRPDYPMTDSRKSMPPPLKPFREHSYVSPPPRHIAPLPTKNTRVRNSLGVPYNWQVPKQNMHLYHAHEQHSHKHRDFNIQSESPCSQCHVEKMHGSHHNMLDYAKKNRSPMPNNPNRLTEKILPLAKSRSILPKPKDFDQKEQVSQMLKQKQSSPISYSDQDMMNRCIRKAQQALKVETSIASDSKETLLPNTAPVFRSGTPNTSSDNTNDVQASLPSKKTISNPAAHLQSSKSLVHSKQNIISFPNPTKAIGLPPPLFSDYNKDSITGIKKSVDETELYPNDHDTRHNLTMTPDLDCAHDDSGESDKISQTKASIDEVKTDDNNNPLVGEISSSIDENNLSKLERSDEANDEFSTSKTTEKDQVNSSLKDCSSEKSISLMSWTKSHHKIEDATNNLGNPVVKIETLDSEKMRNTTKDVASTSSVESDSSKLKKISNRRHTHLSHENKPEISSINRKSLKRSSSNDSSQTLDSNDESDLTSRKMIKKLKLRVIKSPGSERKKCWTLVKQEQPITGQVGEQIQQLIKTSATELQKLDANLLSVNIPSLIDTGNNDMEKDLTTSNDTFETLEITAEEKDNDIKKDDVNGMNDSPKISVKSDEELGIGSVEKNKEDIPTLLSTVTDEHIENALSAVVIPQNNELSKSFMSDENENVEMNIEKDCKDDIANGDSISNITSDHRLQSTVLFEKDSSEENKAEEIKSASSVSSSKSTVSIISHKGSKNTNLLKQKRKEVDLKHTENTKSNVKIISNNENKKKNQKPRTSTIDDPNDNIFSRLYRDEMVENLAIQADQIDENLHKNSTISNALPVSEDSSVKCETPTDKRRKSIHKTRSATTIAKSPEKKPPVSAKKNDAAATINSNQLLRRSCRIRKSSSDKDKAARKKK